MTSAKPIQVYIAGPFTAKTSTDITRNCMRVATLAQEVVKLGAYPQASHLLGLWCQDGHPQDEQWWYDVTLEQLMRCDVVLMTPDWHKSKGAKNEHTVALAEGKPVFYSLSDLEKYIGQTR